MIGTSPSNSGHAVFALHEGRLSAEISSGDRAYYVASQEDGRVRIIETDISGLPNEAPPVVEPLLRKRRESSPAATPQPIHVLLLYTKVLADHLGKKGISIDAFVKKRQQLLDDVYENGDNKLGFAVKIIYHKEYSGLQSNVSKKQLAYLRKDKDVAKLRTEQKADLVALFVRYIHACGIGYLYTGYAYSGFTVTRYDCEWKYTLAHEIGHNLGANHARQDIKGTSTKRCNYGFKSVSAGARTLMAYACTTGKCPRQPYFSDPSIKVGNFKMGIACGKSNGAENVQAVRTNAPDVAKFK